MSSFWVNKLDKAHLLGEGLLFSIQVPTFTLSNGASRTIAFAVGALPVYIDSVEFAVAGGGDHSIDVFEGGEVSGGDPLNQFPRNTWKPSTLIPFTQALDGVTVTTPGVVKFSRGINRDLATAGDGVRILPPNDLTYVTITNNSGSAADHIDVGMQVAPIKVS